MPICFIPVRVWARFLREMTSGKQTKTKASQSRCHSSCKSKIILESICTSCQAMKDCLKNEESCAKYFKEEDLETSHWPCDKCLEALKSIKMCWKIITSKVFHMNINKEDVHVSQCSRSSSIRCIAINWQSEILGQTQIVKNLCNENKNLHKEKTVKGGSKVSIREHTTARAEEGDSRFLNNDIESLSSQAFYKVTRSVSAKVLGNDVACDACNFESEELHTCRQNLDSLQQRFEKQRNEMNACKKENDLLKTELNALLSKNIEHKGTVYSPVHIKGSPYRVVQYSDSKPINVDSEMIITMKKGKNEHYRHISVINVMHKSNTYSSESIDCLREKKEDPIRLLTKVHNKFGAIVKREMNIAMKKSYSPDKYDVDAMSQRINAPSCAALSSCDTVVSAKEN